MLGDDQDKQLQRNQLIAIVLMTLLVVVWTYFFFPTPPPPQQQKPLEGSAAPASSPTESATAAPTAMPIATPPKDTALQEKLPPPAEAEQPDDEIRIVHDHLELVFTRIGARLKRAYVYLNGAHHQPEQLVPEASEEGTVSPIYPLGLVFAPEYLGDALNSRRWEQCPSPDPDTVCFYVEIPGEARIEKIFRLEDAPYLVTVQVRYVNLGTTPRILGVDQKEPAWQLVWAPNVQSGDWTKGVGQEIIWHKDTQNEHIPTAKLPTEPTREPYVRRMVGGEWVAIKSAYFAVALKPETPSAEFRVGGTPHAFYIGAGIPRSEVPPQSVIEATYRVYIGPTKLNALHAAWPGLESLQQFFTSFAVMDWFAKLLLSILNWFHDSVYPNYGLAIIFLTVLVRAVMFPLTWKSMRSMKKLQLLAPEMEKIRREVGDDPQEMNRRMAELYKERGVNPFGGCLPILLQMPIFIALYRMLWTAVELRRAPFFGWITDLSEPDRFLMLPFEIPIPLATQGIHSLNILPILMGIAMVVSSKIMPTGGPAQNQQQKIMMIVMPILFSLICYNMASGLNLYILTSTLLGIAQNYLIHINPAELEEKKTAPSRPKHFYDVVQAKKREMAKAARRERKAKSGRSE